MSDYGDLQEHAEAVLSLLRATPNLTTYPAVGGGVRIVPDGASPPYAAVRFAAARPSGERLDHRSTRMTVRIYVYCVGLTAESARIVSDLVAGALLDVRPDIPGRSVRPIRQEPGPGDQPREDQSTGALEVTITDVYRLDTLPGVDGS